MASLIITIAGNTIALLLAQIIIPGFKLSGGFLDIIITGFILSVLNFFLKPVLKLIFGPIIFLTLGFGLLAINMFILYILDILSESITIQGKAAITLLFSSLIVSTVNIIIHWMKK